MEHFAPVVCAYLAVGFGWAWYCGAFRFDQWAVRILGMLLLVLFWPAIMGWIAILLAAEWAEGRRARRRR